MNLRPNILLVFTDQQRFDTIQALGSSFAARTTAMDFLAREGVAFENCFCTAPVCSPSRSSLMTGLFPAQAGMPGNLHAPCTPLSPAIPTIGNYLRAAGYQTVYNGKWHLGGSVREYGFEVGEESSHDQSTRMAASRFWRGRDWMVNERPFFHVVSLMNPHDLYFYDPAEKVENFTRAWPNIRENAGNLPPISTSKKVDWSETRWGAYTRFYEAMIERADRELGELLHEFRCSGFFNNSWIIFASDHGEMAGEHDLPFKGPFMFEGVVRVPLVIVPPLTRFVGADRAGHFHHEIAPGRRAQLCSLLDVAPTILDIAGVLQPAHWPGRSLLPTVRDASADATHETVFAQWHQPQIFMARTADWKYVCYADGGEELYHIARDRNEEQNLACVMEFEVEKEKLKMALADHRGTLETTSASHWRS